jgi:hypothetical protein
MVRLGFIVEGDSEKIMIESAGFRSWASEHGLEICSPVINAKGGGNLLPQHIEPMLAQFERSQPQHIVILTDLEDAPSIESVKARITETHTHLIFVAVKALEAWFLADTEAMRRWLNQPTFFEPAPEQTPGMPWERIKEVAKTYKQRGPGDNKLIFAKKFCGRLKHQIANAASHPACPSATAFHDALIALANRGGAIVQAGAAA